MIDIGTLAGTLSLRDAFSGVLTGASRNLKQFRDDFTATMRKAAADNEAFAEKAKKMGQGVTEAGRMLVGVSLAASLAIGGVVKLTSDFESSFAGVRKTVNGTEQDLQALSTGFRDMAKEIPVSVNELHAIGEAAGQLGIKTENVLGFTRVMADLGVATNLSSTEAASSLAKFANITQMSQKDFDKLGSTIVALGNNFATTEADIVAMSMRIAGAGNQIGLTEAQILAVGTSLSSVGIEAEAGGSAISKVMIDMAAAVSSGGEDLDKFADAANMSSADFAKAFRDDAAGALNSFITGLGSLESRGKDVLNVLADMGIEEVRMRDALLRSAGAGDLLTRSLALGTQAWKDNNALAKESAERYKTFASQVTILWNRIKDTAVEVGLSLLPTLKRMVEGTGSVLTVVEKLAQKFATLPEPVRVAAAAAVALVAALAPIVLVVGQLITAVGTIAGFGVTGALVLAFGKIVLIAAAVSAALYGIYKVVTSLGEQTGIFNAIGKAWEMMKEKASALWKIIAEPVWESLRNAAHEVGKAFSEVWMLIVEMLTPSRDLNKDLEILKVVLDGVGVVAQVVAIGVMGLAKVVQNFAWGVKEAVGYVRSLINAWEIWTGKDTKLDVPGAPAATGTGAYRAPQMDVDAAIANGNALTSGLEKRLSASTGRAAKVSDELKKLKKETDDAIAAADKLAGDTLAGLLKVDDVENANALADAYRSAQAMGAKLSKETLVEIAEGIHKGIVATQQMGHEVPQSFMDIRDAANAATFDISKFAGTIGIDGVEMMQKMRESVDEATTSLRDMRDEAQDAQWANAIARQVDDLAKEIGSLGAEYEKQMRRFRDGRPQGEAGKAWDALAKEIETGYVEQIEDAVYQTGAMQAALLAVTTISPGFLGFLTESLPDIKEDVKDVKVEVVTLGQSLSNLAGAFNDLSEVGGGLGGFAKEMGEIVTQMSLAHEAGKTLATGLDNIKAGNVASGMIQMAAGIMSAVAALNKATQFTSRWKNVAGGAMSGAAAGAAFGGVGAIFGAIGGGIYGALRRTGPDPIKEAQAAHEQFRANQILELTAAYENLHAEMNGTFTDLLGKAQALGIKLPASLIASIKESEVLGQLTKENKALLEELANAAEVDWKRMEEAAKRYGIPLESLGKTFNQLKINAAAQQIIDDYDMLIRGGTDVGTILHGMKEEISKIVTEAMKLGTTLPANMKPWIDALMEAGLLVDENGEAITDLSTLNFGDPVQTEFEKITGAIEELVRVIKEDLIGALNAIPRNVDVNVNTNVNRGNPNSNPNPAGGGGTGYPGGTVPNGGDYTVGSVPNGGDYTASHGPQLFDGQTGTVVLNVRNHQVFTDVVFEGADERVGNMGYR